MSDVSLTGPGIVRPSEDAIDSLHAGLRFRLDRAGIVAAPVPAELRTAHDGSWPTHVVAGRFSEGPEIGAVGVWVCGDVAPHPAREVDIGPVVAVNGSARAWSVWGAEAHPSGPLRTAARRASGSGLVARAVSACR
ncbi:MAG TPA: hypothetical protein VF228_10385 [Iamia sp.]